MTVKRKFNSFFLGVRRRREMKLKLKMMKGVVSIVGRATLKMLRRKSKTQFVKQERKSKTQLRF
jgi:hypothetical protein